MEDRGMPMRIAICDDENKELLHLKSHVIQFEPGLAISLFLSAGDLISEAQKNPFDIVLLDIEMDKLNGFDAAKRLKQMDNPPLIIFVTNSGEYTIRGYEVAFRYLAKPVEFSILTKYLSAAFAEIAPEKFTVKENGLSCVLPISEIYYFEKFKHHLILYTKTVDYQCRMTLAEAEESISGNSFATPHKGYLVNLAHISSVGEACLTLTNGRTVPLSRRHKLEIERALFNYVRKQR